MAIQNSGSTFIGNGGELGINVKSNSDWVFSLSGISGENRWCSIVGASDDGTLNGNGRETVTIHANAYDSLNEKC